MGYRSDVAYIIVGPTDKFTGWLAAVRLKGGVSEALAEVTLSDFIDIEGGKKTPMTAARLDAPDVKWYPSYSDVQTHERLWESAQEYEETYELSGRFVRIGEDYSDIEVRGFGNFDLYEALALHRSIDIGTFQGETTRLSPP